MNCCCFNTTLFLKMRKNMLLLFYVNESHASHVSYDCINLDVCVGRCLCT